MAYNKIANMKVGSREHIEFTRLLINTIQEYAIFLLETSGHIATWNPGAQHLKGYAPDEIIGKHFSIFYPKKDILEGKPEWELEIAQREGHVEDEGWRVKKDGSKFWANVVITALRDDDGELVGYAKVTRDLTDRRRHEEALRRANTILKQQSVELKELNKSKDEFISLASHQLRTPASGVKQYLGMLMEGYAGELTDTQMAFLKTAYESNNRQITLINDLLRVAQIDAGKIDLVYAKTDIAALIRNVISEQSDKFKKQHQEVSIDISDEPVYASIDERRFRMALENLIDNASKYTPKDGRVSVALNKQGSTVTIAITDTGVGIEKASLAKLFQKFSRIPNHLSDSVGGSGLGLYWAYKIVLLHKGTLDVDSRPGEGSTFTITIPVGGRHA